MLGQVIALSIFFLLAPLAWKHYFNEKGSRRKYLGLESRDYKKDLVYALLGFSLLFSTSFLIVAASNLTGFNDTQKVAETVLKFSAVELAAVLLIQVLAEEVFFRAFLTPKLGAVLSSTAFALAHSGYGSGVEVIAAFVSGLILSWLYLQRKNVFPGFVAHAGFNLLSLITYWKVM